MADPETITAEDVDELNRAALNRSAAIARWGGSALVVIGVLGILAWLWLTVRSQQEADPAQFLGGSEPSDVSLGERITLLTNYVTILVFAGLAVGLGLFLRVAADVGQIKAGGSITGLQVGEEVAYEDVDLDGDDESEG
jgi:hypothetical protein